MIQSMLDNIYNETFTNIVKNVGAVALKEKVINKRSINNTIKKILETDVFKQKEKLVKRFALDVVNKTSKKSVKKVLSIGDVRETTKKDKSIRTQLYKEQQSLMNIDYDEPTTKKDKLRKSGKIQKKNILRKKDNQGI